MESPGSSVLTTIFAVLLTAFITYVIIPMYWTSYYNFRQELIMTYRYLQLHSNILNNKFQKDQISLEFNKKVSDAQYDIRTAWTNLESKYFLIPSSERNLLIQLKKLPTKKEMGDISGELLSISNSTIVFDKNMEGLAEFYFQRRKESIEKVINFIKQYGIS